MPMCRVCLVGRLKEALDHSMPAKQPLRVLRKLVTVRSVDRIVNTRVDITCLFDKQVVTFDSSRQLRDWPKMLPSSPAKRGSKLRDIGMHHVADSR